MDKSGMLTWKMQTVIAPSFATIIAFHETRRQLILFWKTVVQVCTNLRLITLLYCVVEALAPTISVIFQIYARLACLIRDLGLHVANLSTVPYIVTIKIIIHTL